MAESDDKPASSPPAPPAQPKERRSFARRWLVRLPIVVLLFLVTLVVLTQALLWSDLPRRIAEREIGKALGATARIGKLSISWGGRTRLSDVSLTLPLAEEPIAKIASIEVVHTALPLLVWDVNVESAHADGADIRLLEDSAGHWNGLRLLTRRGPAAEAEPPDAAGRRRPALPDSPDVLVTNASVRITRRDGRSGTIEGLRLEWTRMSPVEQKLHVQVGDSATVDGRAAREPGVPHEVHVTANAIPGSLRPLLEGVPGDVAVDARWHGRFDAEGGLAARLEVDRAVAGGTSADGTATLAVGRDGRATVAPRGFTIRPEAGPAVVLASGEASLDETRTIRIHRLRGEVAPAGSAIVDGQLQLDSLDGRLSVVWQRVHHAGTTTGGQVDVATARPLQGGLRVDASGTADIATDAGRLDVTLKASAVGSSLAHADATLETGPLLWTPVADPSAVVRAPALRATVEAREHLIRLASLRPEDPSSADELVATAAFDRSRQFWWAAIDGTGIRLERLGVTAARGANLPPLDLNFDAYGTPTRANVKHLYLRHARARAWATGFFDATDPEPLRLDTWAWYDLPKLLPDQQPDREEFSEAAAALRADDAQISGLVARGVIAGTLQPRNLRARGVVIANDLVVRGRRVGDVEMDVEAVVSDAGGTLRSNEIQLLDAGWTLFGSWAPGDGEPPRLVVSWRGLPADRVGELFKVDPDFLDGVIDSGEAVFDLPSTEFRQIRMAASAKGSGLRYKELTADTLELSATLENSLLTAYPTLTSRGGRLSAEVSTYVVAGRTTARLVDPAELATLRLKAQLDDWPSPPIARPDSAVGDLGALVSGEAALDLDRRQKGLAGLRADAALTSRIVRGADAELPVGDAVLVGRLREGRVELSEFTLNALGGAAVAAGVLDLYQPNQTRLDVTLDNLAPADLAWLAPPLEDVNGRFSGFARLFPAPGERPLAPLELRLGLRSDGGGWRAVPVDSVAAHGFASFTSPEEFRLVTRSAEVLAAGGLIKPFARVSRAPGQPLTQLLTADLEGVELQPFVESFDDDGRPVRGKVSGEVRVYGQARSVERMSAEARVNLTQSDLANFGPIAALYNAMRVGTAGDEPLGEGAISLRVEDNRLTVVNATYFNRGVYVRGYGTVSELERMPDSSLNLTLIGSAQPLRDIKLPFFADADKIMEALQANLTSIRAEGTLKDPVPRQATLSELGDTARRLLVGEVQKE